MAFRAAAALTFFTLVCRMGAKWQRIRSILNPRMLKPKHVSTYSNTINDVVTDFISRLAWLRDTGGQGHMVNDLTGELYKFAFEGEQWREWQGLIQFNNENTFYPQNNFAVTKTYTRLKHSI